MKYAGLVAIVALALAGCSHSSSRTIAEEPYRDQRSVTTRPTGRGDTEADFVVRVEERQGPAIAEMMLMPTTLPPDAKFVASAETFVKRKTPFYATVLLPDHRIELGGYVHSAASDDPNFTLVDIGFADNTRSGVCSTSTTRTIKPGETSMLMACSNGLYVTLVLERIEK